MIESEQKTNCMKYTENQKLGDTISEHYQLLLVMSRFGIPLGFGDDTIGVVCKKNNVDAASFLAVVNYVANGDSSGAHNVDLSSMMRFLKNSHRYYLEFFFPELRRKLIEAIDFSSENKLSSLILNFFDNYVAAVRKHLEFEDERLFTYVERLIAAGRGEAEIPEPINIVRYARQHEQIDNQILELKNIMIKYYPGNGKANALNAVLYDIFSCEEDFKSHCDIEDNIFMPAILLMEEKIRK